MLNELRVFYDKRHHDHEADVAADAANHVHLYTDKALMQREAIKFDRGIQELLKELYVLVDEDGSGTLEEKEYRTLSENLYIALQVFWDPSLPTLSLGQMQKMTYDDWVNDSHGHDHLVVTVCLCVCVRFLQQISIRSCTEIPLKTP
jgi:hypothetical protein